MRLINIIILGLIIILLSGCTLAYRQPIENDINFSRINNSTEIKYRPTILQNHSYQNIINNSQHRINHNYNRNLTLAETVKPEAKLNQEEIREFFTWARIHNIEVIGIDKTSQEAYNNGLEIRNYMDPTNVSGFANVVNGLYRIPEPMLKIMKGKTIYLSHQWGRGYAVLGSWPEQNILEGVNKGIILEQPIGKEDLIHEFGHIVGSLGIEDVYKDEDSPLKELKPLYNNIFKVEIEYNPNSQTTPEGYIDLYSTANNQENFAQHFTYYVLYSEEFRNLAKDDQLLKRKYDFLKNELFSGREY